MKIYAGTTFSISPEMKENMRDFQFFLKLAWPAWSELHETLSSIFKLIKNYHVNLALVNLVRKRITDTECKIR